jgi:hypothetical protein
VSSLWGEPFPPTADGRVRLAHAENNDEGTLKSFADSQITLDTQGRDRRARQLQQRKPRPTASQGCPRLCGYVRDVAENKQGMMAGQATNFELFKHVCETNPA